MLNSFEPGLTMQAYVNGHRAITRMDCLNLYKIYGFLYHISALTLILEGKKKV